MNVIHRKEPKIEESDLLREKSKKERLEQYEKDREKEELIILSMQTHDQLYSTLLSKDILRVQSGWIYTDWDDVEGALFNPIFVPDTRE